VPALHSLAASAYAPYVARIGRPPAPMTADYAAIVAEGHAWVAEEDSAIVGLLVLVPAVGHLLLENVAVHPEAQGRGIGAMLLSCAESRALELGFREIRLFTNQAMTENLAYYPRHGYVETHRTEQAGFQRAFFTKIL
jgi:GNAT superfamily N-acetyltransferase